jgi:hypothetical protein
MLDQIFGRISSSQWIVFAVLVILLVGLSELAWRMGIASSRKKSEADQAGTSGRHSILERFVFPVLVAIVITLITDIDTPRGGLISLDERPLLELNETLRGSSTSTTR